MASTHCFRPFSVRSPSIKPLPKGVKALGRLYFPREARQRSKACLCCLLELSMIAGAPLKAGGRRSPAADAHPGARCRLCCWRPVVRPRQWNGMGVEGGRGSAERRAGRVTLRPRGYCQMIVVMLHVEDLLFLLCTVREDPPGPRCIGVIVQAQRACCSQRGWGHMASSSRREISPYSVYAPADRRDGRSDASAKKMQKGPKTSFSFSDLNQSIRFSVRSGFTV